MPNGSANNWIVRRTRRLIQSINNHPRTRTTISVDRDRGASNKNNENNQTRMKLRIKSLSQSKLRMKMRVRMNRPRRLVNGTTQKESVPLNRVNPIPHNDSGKHPSKHAIRSTIGASHANTAM